MTKIFTKGTKQCFFLDITKHIESFRFHSLKETQTKDIPIESTYSIVHDEHHENGFTISPGKADKFVNSMNN